MKFARILLISVSLLFLSACETIQYDAGVVEREPLAIEMPEPLQLDKVRWKIFEVDSVSYFAVDTRNYENLSKNIEQAQNRLAMCYDVVGEYQKYYENKNEDIQ